MVDDPGYVIVYGLHNIDPCQILLQEKLIAIPFLSYTDAVYTKSVTEDRRDGYGKLSAKDWSEYHSCLRQITYLPMLSDLSFVLVSVF